MYTALNCTGLCIFWKWGLSLLLSYENYIKVISIYFNRNTRWNWTFLPGDINQIWFINRHCEYRADGKKNVQRCNSLLSWDALLFSAMSRNQIPYLRNFQAQYLYFSLRKAIMETNESRSFIPLQTLSIHHRSSPAGRLMKQDANMNESMECRRNLEV